MPCIHFRPSPRPLTRRQAILEAGMTPGTYREDPKIGAENNARRRAEYERGLDELLPQDDTPAFLCGEAPVVCEDALCKEPGCEYLADVLCDWPMGRGKTCDLPLCGTHARHIGEERDLCPVHHALWQKRAGVEAVLDPWPPRRP